MKTFNISCRKVKISISLRGGKFQFSDRGERYVYLKKTHPEVNFTSPTCSHGVIILTPWCNMLLTKYTEEAIGGVL